MIHVLTKFKILLPTVHERNVIKAKSKENFHMAVMLFYILQIYYPDKRCEYIFNIQ